MDFLKEALGEELYSQFEAKISEYNGDEANKDKQIKIGNLSTGEYVGKGKYEALEQALGGKNSELENATKLIEELKKGTKGNDDLQGKISGYESEVQALKEKLAETKLKSAIKVALLSENAADVDYLTFKLESKLTEEGRTLELDENDNIKGFGNILTDLKTQFPTQFASTIKKVDELKLENTDKDKTLTRNDILKMPFGERAKLFKETPEIYQEAMKK